ncbi:hypothetical protein N329_09847, partial [Haliaeetus albicilla]
DQWPLKGKKLIQAHKLIQEQLQQGHTVASTSPWNTLIFVVPKKSGKWRLLQDLQVINAVLQPMGITQPGKPNPTMIPKERELQVIDIKDCFFTIPLHPDDCSHFTFSVPSVNNAVSMQHYQWTVLRQGMTNSPTICQIVVAAAIQWSQDAFPNAIIYHYMDDILIAAETTQYLKSVVQHLIDSLQTFGLQISTEKIQKMPPWKYLGWILMKRTVQPQSLKL